MSLLLEYSDVPDINLYAFVFTSGNLAYKSSTNNLAVFTDPTATGFAIPLTEDSNRQGYYFVNHTGSYFDNNNIFNVELWERVGADLDRNNDILKSTAQIYWNGINSVGALETPKLETTQYVGQYLLGDTAYFNLYAINIYSKIGTADAIPSFNVYGPAGSVVGTGIYSVVGGSDPTLYSGSIVLTSGTYGYGNYRITANALINSYKVRGFTTFNISPSIDINQILGLQGCASGFINDATPSTSSFICTISSSYDDQYNGQVFRSISDGSIIGQGRIVSDFNNSTKRLILNKPLAAAPTNGSKFIIYPIGGELGL